MAKGATARASSTARVGKVSFPSHARLFAHHFVDAETRGLAVMRATRKLRLLVVALAGVVGCAPKPATTLTTHIAADFAKLPRHDLTPGVADPSVVQDNIQTTICVAGYSSKVRPPVSVTNKIKTEVMQQYGFSHPLADYELDHLISLELGGAPQDAQNLWPEAWERKGDRLAPSESGAETKDRFENYLHREVCANRIALSEAQQSISTDWYQGWVNARKP